MRDVQGSRRRRPAKSAVLHRKQTGAAVGSLSLKPSRGTQAAIQFANQNHNDITRQCTVELEARLTEITSDEIKSATSLMQKMRKKCDSYHLAIKQKNAVLQNLQRQVQRLQTVGNKNDVHRGNLRQRSDVLRKTLARLQKSHKSLQMKLKVYNHMQKRLMKEVKATDKRMIMVQQEMKQVEKRHAEVELHHRKLDDRKQEMQKTRSQLSKKLDEYREKQHSELLKIDRVIRESKMETEMINNVIQGEEDSKAGGSKQERLTKMYNDRRASNQNMGKNFREQNVRMQQLEEAFMKIRNSTGLNDVNEIVEKFVNRDKTYSDLVENADSTRQQIDQLKKEKKQIQAAIAEFQNSTTTVGNRDLYREVDEYDQKLAEAQRRHSENKQKSSKLKLLLEESRITVNRFLKTLNTFQGGGSGINENDYVPSVASLPKALQTVKSRVTTMREQLAGLLEDDRGKPSPSSTSASLFSMTEVPTRTPTSKKGRAEATAQDRVNGTADQGGSDAETSSSASEDTKRDGASLQSPIAVSPKRSRSLSGGSFTAQPSLLDSPRADALIFNSLMTAVPDLSKQNLRVKRRHRSGPGNDSAVATLLGIDIPLDDDASSCSTQLERGNGVRGVPDEEEEEQDDTKRRKLRRSKLRRDSLHLASQTLDRETMKKHSRLYVYKKKLKKQQDEKHQMA